MSDPILAFLKSIDDRLARVESHLDESLEAHDIRLNDHDKRFERQTGFMIGGGAVITFFSTVGAWIMEHFFKS